MFGVEDRRGLAARAQIFEQFGMPGIPDISQGGHLHDGSVAGEHVAGITREQDVDGVIEETPVEVVQVVGHLFEEHDRRGMIAEDEIAHHFFAVVFHFRDDLFCAGMVGAGGSFGEVMGVERFVKDGGVRALGKGVHERGRDVARAAPEADAGGVHWAIEGLGEWVSET